MNLSKSILLVLIAAMTTAFSSAAQDGYKIGDKVANFTLKNINDKMVALDDYKNDKGVIVVFTCNHCPYSKLYEDRIIALDKKYKRKGFPVLAINPNDPVVSEGDDFEAMKIRAKSKGFTFPYLFDDGQEVFPKFGATRTPHVFILKNTNKNFQLSYIGAIDNNARDASKANELYVENALDDLLAGKTPRKTETKAIGCSIKVAK